MTTIPDFIEEYPGALSPETCAAIITRFEASGQAEPGRTGAGVQPDQKDSRDIYITGRPEWLDVETQLHVAMLKGLVAYVRKYPYLVLSTLNFEYRDPASGETRRMRAEDLSALPGPDLEALLRGALRPGSINLQHYKADTGGYPAWHSEAGPSDPSADAFHRALLWSVYLNDGFEAGETEFLYQQRKVVPRTGSLLIAPASFVHTHRGNRPGGRDKYIATSWVLYPRFEQLYRT